MKVSEWPEKLIVDNEWASCLVIIDDSHPEFQEKKNQFLNMEKHTKNWKLVSTYPGEKTSEDRMGLGL